MFKALLLTQENKQTRANLTDLDDSALPEGEVIVRTDYTSINYKDALAVTGGSPIVRKWPMVPGIDLAGTVESSAHPDWKAGDRVVINGWGMGEEHWGGMAQKARVPASWLLRLPDGFSTHTAMAVATAGYTAALCVMALQKHGLQPGDGEVLVTGASGGVGSVAVALLAGLGHRVVASTGKTAEGEYLKFLGAAEIIDRATLTEPGKPLQKERWAGVVETVGSHTAVNACAQTRWNGAVAACGLAQGPDFPATMMPFILRGVTLYGINCVHQPNSVRSQAGALIARHVRPDQLAQMTVDIGLSQVVDYSGRLLDGKVRGRTVVDCNR